MHLVPNGIHSLWRKLSDLHPLIVSRLLRLTRLISFVGRWLDSPVSGFRLLSGQCVRFSILTFTYAWPVAIITATTTSTTSVSATTASTAVIVTEIIVPVGQELLEISYEWALRCDMSVLFVGKKDSMISTAVHRNV